MSDVLEEDGTSAPESTAAGDPPVTEEPQVQPASESGNDAPWAASLAERFTDEATRAAVDAYLRDTIQPHITKLETESKENRSANALWNDLREDPHNTSMAVLTQMYGPEKAQAAAEVLFGDGPVTSAETDADEDDDDSLIPLEDLPVAVREMVEKGRAAEEREFYEKEYARVQEENPDVKFDEATFLNFLIAADGDFEDATAQYIEAQERLRKQLGLAIGDNPIPVQAGEAAAAAAENEEPATDSSAPPAIGTSSAPAAPTVPPVQPAKQSMDAAIDDLFAEVAPPAPPTV